MGLLRVLGSLLLLCGSAAAAWDPERSTCVSCHEEEQEEELSRPVREWREDVHVRAEVSCDGCHGGDPRANDPEESMSERAGYVGVPAWNEIPELCGQCHEEIAESYLKGALGRSVGEGGRPPTCVTCHMRGAHRVRPPDAKEILADEHHAELDAFLRPGRTREVILALRQQERGIRDRVEAAERKGMDGTPLRAPLRYVRDTYVRAMHSFEIERLEKTAGLAREDLEGLAARARAYDAEAAFRLRYGLAVVAILAAIFAVLLRLRLALARRERAS
jgi:hypothetical protein